ncbi:hypothetical protein NHF50_00170 [Flavobacterium sp. NRK F10]|uniref:Outer membrane lipoprotein-sorting protein n=1 Tax=Flavobacterium sediminis TaxID=2201181 RepID=A0A2U8QQT0_9FLAO|nr:MULTISPECIES: hypothetical protein [Flavobacterium]AWM12417.1 hypothetical protein DI487_00010 [Flavobacterium sediminis]MCO6173450.1 hypothetical protein [Flavobacterium sp. NRK F10]
MKKFFLIVIVLFSQLFVAQTVQEVLNNVNKEYTKALPLNYSVKYNLYKNKDSKKITESYSGIFKKNEKNEIYQKIDEVEFIWNNNFCLKVIHPDKLMTLTSSQPIITGEIDMKSLEQFCKVKTFYKKGDSWELTLEPNQFSGLPYSKMVIWIDKRYFIKKQLFYYNTGIDFSSDYRKQDISLPVLEIIYSDFSRNSVPNDLFDVKKYIAVTKDNIIVTEKYKEYYLEDQREITIK